jgi:hypothetical protein
MQKIRTHYDNLQVMENASSEVIKGAYKHLSQKWHPDRNPQNRVEAERISKVVNDAYAVLSDPQRRKAHDAWIREQRKDAQQNLNTSGSDGLAQQTAAQQGAPWTFLARAFFMLLFSCAVLTLLVVLPSQVYRDGLSSMHFVSVVLWLLVGRFAYLKLFNPVKLVREEAEAQAQIVRDAPKRRRATRIGWYGFCACYVLSVVVFGLVHAGGLASGLLVGAVFGLFTGAGGGLVIWAAAAIVLGLNGRQRDVASSSVKFKSSIVPRDSA